MDDQNGAPCANCTVELVGVDISTLSGDTVDEKLDRADELLEEQSNPLPDSWDSDLSLSGSNGLATSGRGEYVAVHSKSDWGVDGWVDTIELDNPIINPPAGEEIALSVWNPDYEGGTLTVENTVDDDLYGATVKRNVVVEQIDPFGDVVDRRVLEPNAHTQTGLAIGEKQHDYAITSLQAGVYRIHPEGNEATAYTIVVGDTADLRSSFRTELENQAGDLTESARDIQEEIESGRFYRTTTTTNATGHYSTTVPSKVRKVGVSAYSIDGDVLTDMENPTPGDMRDWIGTNAYNGSVVFSLEPTRYTTPNTDADVDVRKFSSPPYQALDEWASQWAHFRDLLENKTLSEIGSIYSVPLDEWNRDELENGAGNLTRIMERSNADLIDRWEEITGKQWGEFSQALEESEATNAALRESIRAMERTISELRDQMSSEPPDVGVGDGGDDGPSEVTFRQPYSGDFSADDVVATWYDHNGTTRPIPSEYISVDKRAGRGDVALVENYPIPEGSTGGTIGVLVVSEDGNLGRGEGSVTSPSFSGDVPSIASIDASTLRPGPSERVSLDPRLETAGVELASVDVYDGTGSTVDATLEGGQVAFTPASTQTHVVRMTFETSSGTPFVETLRVPVGDSAYDYPESVAVRDGRLGVYALAGDEIDAAKVDISDAGSSIDITALVEPDQGTNEIHYYLSEAPATADQSLTARVVQGEQIDTATNINRHVGVYLHGRELSSDAVVYRHGSGSDASKRPIPASEETRGGLRKAGDDGGTIIQSYTSGNGEASISINNDPGFVESFRFQFDVWVSSTNFPLLVMVPSVPIDVAPIESIASTLPTVDVGSIVDVDVPVVG